MFAISLLALAAVLAASDASARDVPGVSYLRAAPAALKVDTAYVLMRVSTAKTGLFPIQQVLLRVPTAQETNDYLAAKKLAYDAALPKLTAKAKDGAVLTIDEFEFYYQGTPNAFVVENGKFLEDGEMRTVLMEVPVGTYILYGTTAGAGGLVTCNCLGTVSFEARAGVITDVGALYADKVHKPSPIPHLEDNLGPQMFQYGFIFGAGLVPADATTPIPASLQGLKVAPAQFTVVGQYYEPGAGSINRLAPIPGLLGYRQGRPVDLRIDKSVP